MKNKRSLQPHNVDRDARAQVMNRMVKVEYSGVLPPAAELERYEALYPGITQEFLDMVRKQSEHRMSLENVAITSGVKNTARGQIFAFILALVVIVGGFILLMLGKDGYGIAAILGALATLVGVFIYGSEIKKKERIEKSRNNPDV